MGRLELKRGYPGQMRSKGSQACSDRRCYVRLPPLTVIIGEVPRKILSSRGGNFLRLRWQGYIKRAHLGHSCERTFVGSHRLNCRRTEEWCGYQASTREQLHPGCMVKCYKVACKNSILVVSVHIQRTKSGKAAKSKQKRSECVLASQNHHWTLEIVSP